MPSAPQLYFEYELEFGSERAQSLLFVLRSSASQKSSVTNWQPNTFEIQTRCICESTCAIS